MKQIIKLGFTLALFAGVSCFLLAVVNNVTAPVIAEYNANKASLGMKVVFQEAQSFEEVKDFKKSTNINITIDKLYFAKADDNVIGAVAQVTGATYESSTIVVGVKPDGIITGMQILSSTDTPGFGLKASDPSYTVASGKTFYGQFEGKNAKDGFVVGETFDAIAGATITTDGIAQMLKQGTESALDCLSSN